MDTSSSALSGRTEHCPSCGKQVQIAPTEPEGDFPCPQCGNLLWFVHCPVDDGLILTFLPGLISASESLSRVDEVALAIAESPQVVIKLAHLPLVTSTFINMLVALHRRADSETPALKLCGLHPDIREVLRVTKIEDLFAIYDDEQAALTD